MRVVSSSVQRNCRLELTIYGHLETQAFYIGQTPIMSNEEFDNLKEELLWEGSSVVVLSKLPTRRIL